MKQKNWRDYIQQDNPVAAALLSKMGYAEDERVQVKKEFLRMMVRLELDEARMSLLAGFFETYLKLSEEEENRLLEEVKELHPEEEGRIVELTNSWVEKGRVEGKLEGKAEGKMEVVQKWLEEEMGADVRLISKISGLSVEEVTRIKEEIQRKQDQH